MRATRDMYLGENGEVIPELSTVGYMAAGVPGTVAGLSLALEKFGSMNLPALLQPAIELAENGFVIDYSMSELIEEKKEAFARFPSTAEIFLKNGELPEEGELLVQKDLAKTLRLIAEKGSDAFYRGQVAELIVESMEANGGLIGREDLANYRPAVI